MDALYLVRTCLPWLVPDLEAKALVASSLRQASEHVLPWLLQNVAHVPLARARLVVVDLAARMLRMGWHHARAGGHLLDFLAACLDDLEGGSAGAVACARSRCRRELLLLIEATVTAAEFAGDTSLHGLHALEMGEAEELLSHKYAECGSAGRGPTAAESREESEYHHGDRLLEDLEAMERAWAHVEEVEALPNDALLQRADDVESEFGADPLDTRFGPCEPGQAYA